FGGGSTPQVVIRWRPGINRAAAIDRVTKVSGAPPIPPIRPAEINRLLQVDRMPAILAAFLAFLGLVGIGHAVVTNGQRRRRDLAMLQTLGFRSRQLVATIGAQALTLMLVGLVIGIPVGIVLGRIVWGWIARGVGIAPDASIPLMAILLTVIGAILGAALVAAFPARSATRIHPATALRSE
ncbi:MAG: FtsX-like permease family protein, partial [Acidimicrobiia bacterium]